MKLKQTLAASLVAILPLMAAPALAKTQTLAVDPAGSAVKWTGKKVTGAHNGTVSLKSGQVELENNKLKGGNFEIDMTSIKVEDLKDPEYNGKLTGHLRSDDFFGVDKHPTSTFKITSVKELKKGTKGVKDATHEIAGDLTIKGVTQPVVFPAKISVKGDQATATGKLMVDRTKYNIRYGSGKFFENLGDKMINDEFEIELDLKAKN